MAFPGSGYRSVWSLALEIGFHLLEPYCVTTLITPVAAAGVATPTIGTLGFPVNALYTGALLIIDSGLSQEVVTVTAVNPAANTFTATFALPHLAGAPVIGVTFPTQALSGDFFFTQAEILSYIARAQNDFLAEVPLMSLLNYQSVAIGQVYQQLACDAIEIQRIASSYQNVALVSLSRVANLVTATSVNPHGLIQGQKFSIFGGSDPSFTGAFVVGNVTGANTWTYTHDLANSSSTGGWAGVWIRLWEVSQKALTMQDPSWRVQNIARLSSWYEDRTGNYLFGVNGIPSSNFPIEVLVSIRDNAGLEWTDYFLVPDPFLHYVKYRALEYIFEKDGEQRDPQRAQYCRMRWERGISTSQRWLEGVFKGMSGAGVAQAMGRGRR